MEQPTPPSAAKPSQASRGILLVAAVLAACALGIGWAFYADGLPAGEPSESQSLASHAGMYEGSLLGQFDNRMLPVPSTLELKPNGRFYHTTRWANKPPRTASGTFEVDGDRLILKYQFSSKVLRIRGSKLTEGEAGEAELVRKR